MNAAVSTLTVYINDEPRAVSAPVTLLAVLGELGLAERRGVAIAIDGTVVPRGQWPVRQMAEGERVLVIQATQGG